MTNETYPLAFPIPVISLTKPTKMRRLTLMNLIPSQLSSKLSKRAVRTVLTLRSRNRWRRRMEIRCGVLLTEERRVSDVLLLLCLCLCLCLSSLSREWLLLLSGLCAVDMCRQAVLDVMMLLLGVELSLLLLCLLLLLLMRGDMMGGEGGLCLCR